MRLKSNLKKPQTNTMKKLTATQTATINGGGLNGVN
jgi:hypothetical protein